MCGCGLQRSPEMALTASTSSEPWPIKKNSLTLGDDVISRTPGFELLVIM